MTFSFSSAVIGFVAGVVAAVTIAYVALSPSTERIESDSPKPTLELVTDVPSARVMNARSNEPMRAPASSVAELQAQVTQLHAEVVRLRSEPGTKRQDEKDDEDATRDRPVPFPAQIAERHTEKGLMTAVQAALVELDKRGEVEAIDCSENPCLAQVRVFGAVEHAQLRKTQALAAYKNDAFSVSSGSVAGENVLVIGFREPMPDVAPDDPQREHKREQIEAERRVENERRNRRANELLQSVLHERRSASVATE